MRFNIGKSVRVCMAMTERDISEIAQHFDVSEMTVYRWKAQKDQRISRIVALAEYFEMSVEEFIQYGR